jgi:ABC-type methionine transport system ATPase subunit
MYYSNRNITNMNRREYLIGGIGLASATTIGSIAFTAASVSRSVNSNIAADSSATIGLTAGSVAAVTENASGQIVIDTAGNSDTDTA